MLRRRVQEQPPFARHLHQVSLLGDPQLAVQLQELYGHFTHLRRFSRAAQSRAAAIVVMEAAQDRHGVHSPRAGTSSLRWR